MSTKTYIGQPLKRVDARGKVTGETQFLTDISVDGMIYSAPVYSRIPFGSITSIDSSEAQQSPGFIKFISAKDIPGENQVGVITNDQPLFADKTVRYIGDSIGLIVADNPARAFDIAKLIRITYTELDPIFTIEKSQSVTTGFIHENNISCQHKVIRGNVEDAFANADKIVEAEFTTAEQEHYYLEPQACIVTPLESGGVKILGSLQCPFYVQKAVSKVLGIPFNKVIVEQAPTGGAFGGKEDVPSEICARVALAAIITKRPVKMVYGREDDIQLTSKRHPFKLKYKVGVTDDGIITAAEVRLEENSGAYSTLSSVVSYRSAVQAMGPYVVPNVNIQSISYYTNLPPNGAFRGFGSPQAAFGHERMMDIVAEKIGMDSYSFRKLNIIKPNDQTITGQRLTSSVGAMETLKKSYNASNWGNCPRPQNEGRIKTGYGIALTHYGNCLGAAGWFMDGSAVKITLHRDGSVTVSFGLVEMGQGALTVVTQMTAEAFGIAPSRIQINPTSTEYVADSGPAVASRNVIMTGQAIINATENLLPEIKLAASKFLDCPSQNIVIENDKVTDNAGNTHCSFGDLTDYMYRSNYRMETTGWWHVPELNFNPDDGNGEAYFSYSFATHLAKVKVDTLTGLVKVQKVWAAHDVGTAINPAGIEGQVEGGISQGIGWAVTENLKYNNGLVQSQNLSTYLLPTANDISDVEVIIIEEPEPQGPWGAKGIGEPAIIPTGAAIANAVSNAIGQQVNQLPILPEYVLDLINQSKEQ